MKKVIIIGGDNRQIKLRECLMRHGFEVDLFNAGDKIENISLYEYVVLPIPVSKDGVNIYCSDKKIQVSIDELCSNLSSQQIVFGGMIGESLKKILREKHINYNDILENENFVIGNAHLTAQGCLRLLLENTEKYIVGSKALVIGFGKVATALSMSLKALGLDVYIAARSSKQLQIAKCFGYKTVKLSNIASSIYYFDYVFGTVPANVLNKDSVNLLRSDCIYFELASAPYTAKKEDFITLDKKYVFGGSLPGKYLPQASAEMLSNCILQYISRQKE